MSINGVSALTRTRASNALAARQHVKCGAGQKNAIQWRRVVNIWNGDYPDVICSSLSLSCQHCTEPQCLDVCPVSAIYKNPDGLVLVDPEKCIGCQACFKACPYGVPQYGADGLMQKCDMCVDAADARPGGSDRPPCVATCPTHALGPPKNDALRETPVPADCFESTAATITLYNTKNLKQAGNNKLPACFSL